MTDIGEVAGRAVAAGAGGFAAGGPVGALIAVAASVVPDIVRSIAGDTAGTAAAAVADAVQTVTGTSDPLAAAGTLAADPAKALELRASLLEIQLKAEADRRRDELEAMRISAADVAGARGMATGSPEMAHAQIRIAYGVLGLFSMVLVGVWLKGVPPGAEAILNILLGMLSGSVVAIISFFFGGSVGSQDKSGFLNRITAAVAGVPTAAVAPPAAPRPSIFTRRS